MYAELHCHTHYSLLDGASSPETLLDRALALGLRTLAITDHDGLYGAVEFWRAARARGVHPVIGAEITLAHGSHLTLLAETQAGYAHLSRLITLGHTAPLSLADLAGHAQGLLCLSGCREGMIAQAILAGDEALARRAAGKLAGIFGRDRFWIELQRHLFPGDAKLHAGLLGVAGWLGAGVVATNDVHYATPENRRLHDVLTATRHNMPLAELGSHHRLNGEFYLKSPEAMAVLFADCPQAVANTEALAERCQVSLDFSDRRLPAFPPRTEAFPHGVPPSETEFSLLYRLCHAGLLARYQPVTPQALRQLAHELSVIQAAGLAGYFLIVWDIVRFSRSQGIRCQGRGSAANSLVAYVLGITPVDPLAHNLLFERFLSERSDTMPDIDVDFAADRRDEVIAYVYERYGADHAAMVCNVVTYQWRSAVRDAARALGYGMEAIAGLSSHRSTQPGEHAEVYALAEQMLDVPRHISVHVGGMLITAQPLVEVVPLQPAAKPGIVVAQWNKDSVEDAGLIKIDLLALRTLGMVTEAVDLARARHDAPPWDIDALPLDDPAVYRLLAEADTIGCFQVESRAQSQMLPRLQPANFADLTIQVSIVRPGPIQGGMVHPYLRRRAGLRDPRQGEPVTYLHPLLAPVLRETLGVIIFQEQVIRVAVALAGFTPGEADLLRRAMSRGRSTQAMAGLQARFVAGALEQGVARETAEEVFRQLEGFATYGFCKSHAAAFALVAYQTLWLKAHYPAEFFCALLNQQPMGFYSPDVVVNDAKRHGLAVLRPHVNASEDACTLEQRGRGAEDQRSGGAEEQQKSAPAELLRKGGEEHRDSKDIAISPSLFPSSPPLLRSSAAPVLRLGLRYLAGLGEAGRERLLAARAGRPFASLADFCRRTRLPRPLTADLIRAGALDGLGDLSLTPFPRRGGENTSLTAPARGEENIPLSSPARGGEGGRGGEERSFRRQLLWSLGALHYEEEALLEEPDVPAELPELSEGEALAWDYELLGLSPDDHPLRLLRPRLRAYGVLTAAELFGQRAGKIVRVAGLVVVRQTPPTAKGHLFVTLEDETGLANLIVRPDLFAREREVLDRAIVLLAEGTLQRENAATSVLVRRVERVK